MGPIHTPRADTNKKIRALVAFISDLQAQLPTAAASRTSATIVTDLEKQIHGFPINLGRSCTSECEELDGAGRTLWNLCTSLRRRYDGENLQQMPVILLLARVFAFFLLDLAHKGGNGSKDNARRLMKIGVKAAKNCIDSKEAGLALKVLEKLGAYEVSLKAPGVEPSLLGDEGSQRLIAEYYVLRTALAWQQDQFDVAEHMYKKAISSNQIFDVHTVECLADVLYEIGKDLVGKKQYTLAVKWLERAHEVLMGQELDHLSFDVGELRISIIESSIKALLGLKTPEFIQKAESLIKLLEDDLGDKLIVLLLKLDLLSADSGEAFDSNAYGDVLRRMALTLLLCDANIRLLVFHIRRLNEKNPSLACAVLDKFFKLRIGECDKVEWGEKLLVTRLWMATGQKDDKEVVVQLESTLSLFKSSLRHAISPAAALAGHTLIWKRVESNFTQGRHDSAEMWCRVAMHPIFDSSGELNMARFSRKLLLCALGRQDIGSAREIFSSMSDVAKKESMTQFLMYKIAIRCGEAVLAAECLQAINSTVDTDHTLLYACVLDAQQAGSKAQAVAALQLVLEKYSHGMPSLVHLPSLLRITIQLTISLVKDSKHEQESFVHVEKLSSLFEGAITFARKKPSPAASKEPLWTIPELDWFSKNSYNLAIQHLATWNSRHILHLLRVCIAFIDQYPQDISEQTSDDLSLRKMFCNFSAATALIALARGEDNIETQMQDYLDMRKHVASFDDQLQQNLGKLEEGPALDLHRKLAVLLAFDFEAACQLKAWDDLGEIILKSDVCKSLKVYQLMADCILAAKPPTQVLITTLKKIINATCSLDLIDSHKLAKYMRCLYQIALPSAPLVAEELLDKICHLAQESAALTETPYPVEELEWISTRSFNHAVDLYCQGDDEACRRWAEKALMVASFCNDGGVLEGVLQSRLVSLRFDA